ncbi:hypothetical protein [Mesorhizobium sp.]
MAEEECSSAGPGLSPGGNHSIVLLNGGGFEAPNWSVRVSIVNLQDDYP